MKFDVRSLMNQAAHGSRVGNLMAATRAIQSALAGSQAPSGGSSRSGTGASMGDVIDIDAVQVRDVLPNTEPSTRQGPSATSDGSFVEGSHASAHDRREYKLYIPPQAADALHPLPLVVMLHGCTQDAADFAAGTAMNAAAHEQGFFVLYPEQSAQANPQRCWNWFKHSHQTRDRGEPALIASMVRSVMATHAIDPARVWVAGLSAGGAMAAILARTHPDLFAAVGVHSGLAAGAARDLPSAMSAMRQGAPASHPPLANPVPAIVFHGDADGTVHPANGAHAFASAGSPGLAPGAAAAVDHLGRRGATRRIARAADGSVQAEHWLVHGAPHAWSGGSSRGSYTDALGPDATAEMLRFFFEHPRKTAPTE